MPQTIQIETQAEQQGLTHLGAQRTTGRASRELALHRTEQTLLTAVESTSNGDNLMRFNRVYSKLPGLIRRGGIGIWKGLEKTSS